MRGSKISRREFGLLAAAGLAALSSSGCQRTAKPLLFQRMMSGPYDTKLGDDFLTRAFRAVEI